MATKTITDADILAASAQPAAAPIKVLTDADIEAAQAPAAPRGKVLTDDDVAKLDEADNEIGGLEASLRAFGQGVAAEWLDEGIAVVKSAAKGTKYDDELAVERATFKAAAEQHPNKTRMFGIAGGISTAFIPGLNLANRAATGLRAAALMGAAGGAVMGAGASEADSVGGVLKDAAVGAGVGAIAAPVGAVLIGGAAKGIAKGFRAISQAVSKSEASEATKTVVVAHLVQRMQAGENITEEIAEQQLKALGDDVSLKVMERALPSWRAIDKTEKFRAELVDRDWVSWVLGRNLGDDIDAPLPTKVLTEYEEAISKWNDNALHVMWRNHKKEKVLMQAVRAARADMPEKFAKLDDPMASGLFNSPFKWMANTRGALQRVDRVTGLNLSGIEMKLSGAEIKFKNTIRPYVHKMDELLRGLSREEHDEVVWELRNFTDEKLLTPKAAAYNNFYKTVRTELEQHGVTIPERPVFMPRRSMMADDARAKLTAYITANNVDDEVLRSVSFLAGRKITEPAEALKFVRRDMLRVDIIKGITSRLEASASQIRKDAVPDLLVENDLRKATMQYLTANFRAAVYREPLEELSMNIRALQQLGLTESAAFTRDIYARIMGQPGMARSFMLGMSGRMKAIGQELIEKDTTFSKAAGKTMKMMPETLGWTLSHYYSNLLGASPKSVIRNSLQVFQTAIPELGLKDGGPLVTRAINKALSARIASKESMENFLTSRNLSDKIDMEAVLSPMRSAVREAIGTDVPVAVLDKIANTAMWGFTKADQMNRYVAWHVGQELAEEIAKGGAVKFLAGMPSGVKAEVKHLLLNGAHDELKEYMSRYIVAKTQFNYTRADLSKFGHEFGSVVNMFMKWPSTVGADVFNTWRAHQDNSMAVSLTEKYFLPLGLYMGAEAALKAADMDGPHKKFFIGDLNTMSPIMSIPSAVGMPPIITAAGDLYDLGEAVATMDGEKFDRLNTQKRWLKRLEPIPGIGLGATTFRRLDKYADDLSED